MESGTNPVSTTTEPVNAGFPSVKEQMSTDATNNTVERTSEDNFLKTSSNRTLLANKGREPKGNSEAMLSPESEGQSERYVRSIPAPEKVLENKSVGAARIDPELQASVDNDQSSSNSGPSSPPDSKPPLTRRQKITLLSLTISCILDTTSYSMLLPFFPMEADKKGVSPTVVGFIFGIYSLVTFIFSPIYGKYLPLVGAKFMYLSGLFVAGGCSILFGVLDKLPDGREFVVFCFVIRSIEAFGAAAAMTALYTIVAKTYPERVAQMIGLVETFVGIGFMIGPPFGGVLYQIGGYQLPFMFLGVCVIISVIINIFLLPPLDSQQDESGSLTDVLRILPIWSSLFALFISSVGAGFVDPSLSPHLAEFNLSPWAIGLFFFISSGVYAASSPVFGYIIDKKDVTKIMMILGFYVSGLAYLLVGPSELLHLPNELWIVAVGLGICGLGWGSTQGPPFQDMLQTSLWYGLPDNLQTQAVISGLYSSTASLGLFAGPSMAGVMIDNLGFKRSSDIIAGINFLATIGLGLFCCWEFQCGKGRRKPQGSRRQKGGSDEGRDPLLPGNQGSINVLENSLQNPEV